MEKENMDIELLKKAVLKEAEVKALSAAQAGAPNDYGARMLREQVKWYEKGQRGEYPEEWERYSKYIDPEFEDYLRLKEKFEK